ncbi:hypothetical protein RN001_001215 [Aquatica leii]|uniref:Uncharacterized protein n=1 Tax=Aquatica leii TaxID=1421715 RepID=A0AAN7Q3S3_9COLE|nr:hypothetical protein RN001_001215 [Aquatica leii]
MTVWLKSITLLIAIGYAKAQHFLHFVILGAFGLIGLWLLNALIKDVDKLFNKPSAVLTKPKLFFVKRSIVEDNVYNANNSLQEPHHIDLNVDWKRILTSDPLGCVQSFICQLAAKETEALSKTESVILRLIKSPNQENWATKRLNFAVNYGKEAQKLIACQKYYSYCPYAVDTMMNIIKFF